MKKNTMTTLENIERIYGVMPKKPVHLSYDLDSLDTTFAAGKAELRKEKMIIQTEDKVITLPFISLIPKNRTTYPALITVIGEKAIPNRFLPAEEIIDRGYGIYIIFSEDICDFSNKKKGIYNKVIGSRRKQNSSGEIAVIGWAISRLAECICDRQASEINAIIAVGHGIYARAAMLAGGYSREITQIIANGLFSRPIPYSDKIKQSGLTPKELPLFYSPDFNDDPYGDEAETLLDLCKSKRIMIGSAEDGDESDTEYETDLISKFFKDAKEIKTKRKSPIKALWQSENFSYHIREGADYFSRDDWNVYLDFIEKKLNNCKF